MRKKTTLQRIALEQEDPAQFVEDLRGIKKEHEDTPEGQRRFKLEIELDEDDLDAAIEEVAAVVYEDA